MEQPTNSNTTTTVASNQHPAMGGPIDQPITTVQQPTQVTSPAVDVPKPIYYNGRKFDSADDLAKYTSQVEAQAQQYQAIQQVINPTPQAPAKPKIDDLWYADPTQASAMLLEEAETRVMQKLQAERARDDIQKKFYTQFPDLAEHKDFVEMHANKLRSELDSMPPDAALSKLASATRARLAAIKGAQTATEELPSTPATTLGATSGPPSRTQTAPSKPMTMVEQMAALNSKRAKR